MSVIIVWSAHILCNSFVASHGICLSSMSCFSLACDHVNPHHPFTQSLFSFLLSDQAIAVKYHDMKSKRTFSWRCSLFSWWTWGWNPVLSLCIWVDTRYLSRNIASSLFTISLSKWHLSWSVQDKDKSKSSVHNSTFIMRRRPQAIDGLCEWVFMTSLNSSSSSCCFVSNNWWRWRVSILLKKS